MEEALESLGGWAVHRWLSALVRAGKYERALQCIQELPISRTAKIDVYVTVLERPDSGPSDLTSRDKALAGLEAELMTSGWMDFLDDGNLFERAIEFMLETKGIDEARRLAEAIKDAHGRSNALSAIAERMVREKRVDEAIVIARRIETDTFGVQRIFDALCNEGQVDDALQLAWTLDGQSSGSGPWNSIAEGYLQSGRIDEAVKVAAEQPMHMETVLAVAEALVDGRRSDEAEPLWDRAVDFAQLARLGDCDVAAALKAGQALHKAGQVDRLEKVVLNLTSFVPSGYLPADDINDDLVRICSELARWGKLQRA